MAGAWRGSTRRRRLPKDWPEIRRRVLERDGRRCQWVRADTGARCGLPAGQVDHVDAGDDHRDANLRALCDWHHFHKSSREGNAAKSGGNSRVIPAHPGIIP